MLDVRFAVQSLSEDAAANLVVTPSLPIAPNTSIDAELRASREHARRLSEMYGSHAAETAAAWDAVEEILAMKAHRRADRSGL